MSEQETQFEYEQEDLLEFANHRRIETIQDYCPSVNPEKVFTYLNREKIDTTIIDVGVLCKILGSLISDDEIAAAMRKNDHNPMLDIALANQDNQVRYPQLYDQNDPETFIHTLIAEIKTIAIIYKGISGQEPGPLFRRRFLLSIGRSFIEHGSKNLPKKFAGLFGKQDAEELDEFKKTYSPTPAAPADLLVESGHLPPTFQIFKTKEAVAKIIRIFDEELRKIQERKQTELTTAQRTYIIQLTDFVRTYRNPRKLLDAILEVEDGRIPVRV